MDRVPVPVPPPPPPLSRYSSEEGSLEGKLFTPSPHRFSANRRDTVAAKLNLKLGPDLIDHHTFSSGFRISVLSGWRAINIANAIFGEDGWRTTLMDLTVEYCDAINNGAAYNVGVSCIMRVSLANGTFHDDVGFGATDNSASKMQAFEKAKRAAVVDAIKRCLRTFGQVLGGCLYDKQFNSAVENVSLPKATAENNPLYTTAVDPSNTPANRDRIGYELRRNLGPEFIKQRWGAQGKGVAYLEGWQAIELANAVFGFDGWSSEIVEMTLKYMDVVKGNKYNVGVSCVVRVTYTDEGGKQVYHDDVGFGWVDEAFSKNSGLEKSKKEAVTDALKRALKTFGNSLGSCVYNKAFLTKVARVKSKPFSGVDETTLIRSAPELDSIPPGYPGEVPFSHPEVGYWLQPDGGSSIKKRSASKQRPSQQITATQQPTASDNPFDFDTMAAEFDHDDFLVDGEVEGVTFVESEGKFADYGYMDLVEPADNGNDAGGIQPLTDHAASMPTNTPATVGHFVQGGFKTAREMINPPH
ncbi:dsRNA-binding domain-like protein [Ramicandelaber brevisporus]|nr:dsRNA-binding domain-like protein [Ramicandelaber brevisporus]